MTLAAFPEFAIASRKACPFSSFTVLDAANEQAGHCGYFVTPDGGTRSITHICWATESVTTGDDILCQIESLNTTTGLPGGIVAAGASGTQTVADGNDYTYFETALSTPYTLAPGWFAVTFTMQNASKNLRIVKAGANGNAHGNGSYVCEKLGGAGWATASYRPNVALKCSDGSYLIPLGSMIIKRSTNTLINTSSDPRYIGNKIITPYSARITGVHLLNFDPTYDVNISLVDVSGNVLKGDNESTDMIIAMKSIYRNNIYTQVNSMINFPCPKSLSASTSYYLIFVPQSASNVGITRLEYESEAIKRLDLLIPSGWTINHVTSPLSVSWTEAVASLSGALPIFDQIDLPSGSGGGPVMGGMVVR